MSSVASSDGLWSPADGSDCCEVGTGGANAFSSALSRWARPSKSWVCSSPWEVEGNPQDTEAFEAAASMGLDF